MALQNGTYKFIHSIPSESIESIYEWYEDADSLTVHANLSVDFSSFEEDPADSGFRISIDKIIAVLPYGRVAIEYANVYEEVLTYLYNDLDSIIEGIEDMEELHYE